MLGKKKKKQEIIKKLQKKYRLTIFNDSTFEEVWSYPLTRFNVYAYVGSAIIVLITLTTILIAFTPLREFIPGYTDRNMQRNILTNALKIDSLDYELEIQSQYLNNVKAIMEGRDPDNYEIVQDSSKSYDKIKFSKSKDDSLLREYVEGEEQFNLSLSEEESGAKKDFKSLHFFPPIKGLVVSSFNPSQNHYGTDIVSAPNEVVCATLEGTVTLATWTFETGYIIQIQHNNDLISVYKHNSRLFKTVGNRVKAGDAIAVVGNTGEITTGPHLHFELWHSGVPVNAEEYIKF